MEYSYTYRNNVLEYMKFRLRNVYSQWTCVVNFVFTFAMICLIISKWTHTNILGKVLMIIGVLIFPVLQPLAMYIASARQAHEMKADTTLSFDDKGMHITVKEHVQNIPWKDFYTVIRRGTTLVIVPDGQHAYILPARVTGDTREALYQFITEKIKTYSRYADQQGKVK